MRISVFGSGYVGLVAGTCFAELGNHVVCYDPDKKKTAMLKKGISPIYEPGLEDMIESNASAGRLEFTTDINESIKDAEVIFLAVGTPSAPDGSADLSYLFQAAQEIVDNLRHDVVVATKSTVPVGTADALRKIFKASKQKITVASNPEFLREGAAVKDFMNPERVIVGLDDHKHEKLFEKLYRGVVRTERPLVFMSVRSAELTKYACNAFLATKISFVNEIAHLAEHVGANIGQITHAMGLDSRIGSRFLAAGVGYGGSCFPKDVRALQHIYRDSIAEESTILQAVELINARHKSLPLVKLRRHMEDWKDKVIAVWGLTFKPRTDDVRESAALTVIPALVEEGAIVRAYDPKGVDNIRPQLPETVIYCQSAFEAVTGADALILLTEWDEFRTVDLAEILQLKRGSLLIDGRNVYKRDHAHEAGFIYEGIGVSHHRKYR